MAVYIEFLTSCIFIIVIPIRKKKNTIYENPYEEIDLFLKHNHNISKKPMKTPARQAYESQSGNVIHVLTTLINTMRKGKNFISWNLISHEKRLKYNGTRFIFNNDILTLLSVLLFL